VRYNELKSEFKYKLVLSKSNGAPTETRYYKSREAVIKLIAEELTQVGFLYNRIAIYRILEEVNNNEF